MSQIFAISGKCQNPARLPAAGAGVPPKSTVPREFDHDCAVSFGPFSLLATQRLLLAGDKAVHLGSRALDLLIALIARRGELVSKEELMAQVWPNTYVEEANLTVHIAALRRALGDGQNGYRYIINIPGRGYRFIAPITVVDEPTTQAPNAADQHNLPAMSLINRDSVSKLLEQLPTFRILGIIEAGEIGKFVVALAASKELIQGCEHRVWLIELATIADPCPAPTALEGDQSAQFASRNTSPNPEGSSVGGKN
jgi:DNA-binding winged helix-turn-helix (wHTH) protein